MDDMLVAKHLNRPSSRAEPTWVAPNEKRCKRQCDAPGP